MTSTEPPGKPIYRKLSGELTLSRLMDALKELYKGDPPPRNVLWDLRQGSLTGLTDKEMDQLKEFIKEYGKVRRGGKAAVVVSRDVDFGISRMIQLSGEKLPFEVEIFRTIEEGEKWLGEDG